MTPKIMLAIAGLSALTTGVFAGDGELAANKIKPELIKNAHAVIRYDKTVFELKGLDKTTEKHSYAITVLDQEGIHYVQMIEQYDKINSIESIEGTLYDASGKKIKSLKKGDISDESGAGSNLASDSRIKRHLFYNSTFPYTVAYEIETESKQSMFFSNWHSQWGLFLSVESTDFTAIVPESYNLRYKSFNYSGEPAIVSEKGKKQYSWHAENMNAITQMSYFPGWIRFTPCVYLAPTEFEIEDYKGNMTDWSALGKFQLSLNAGGDVLPAQTKAAVHQLVDNLPTTEKKVERLYQYLQENTRYISIQLGVGGWRPLDANFVASKGYGDCKALSNFMYSLLKEAGIKSYYTLIKAGDDAVDMTQEFIFRDFNHVIICVPNKSDTIWLECTSQTTPPGYMGGFTGNRHALLITEDGGRLVTTPIYTAKENTEICKASASVDEAGNMKVSAVTRYQAIEQDDLDIHNWSDEQKLKRLKSSYDLPTYDIVSYKYAEEKGRLPVIEESLEITANNYATVSGRRLFIIPNLLSRSQSKPLADEGRKYDLRIIHAFTDMDTVEISIPTGYQPESVPSDVSLESKFGRYTAKVKIAGDRIYYYRQYEHLSGYFPANDYMELSKFYSEVYKADRNKVVFVKK